jgi:hypothetical protein
MKQGGNTERFSNRKPFQSSRKIYGRVRELTSTTSTPHGVPDGGAAVHQIRTGV